LLRSGRRSSRLGLCESTSLGQSDFSILLLGVIGSMAQSYLHHIDVSFGRVNVAKFQQFTIVCIVSMYVFVAILRKADTVELLLLSSPFLSKPLLVVAVLPMSSRK